MGVSPGEHVRVSTRRGEIEIATRADANVSPGTVLIPFAFVEAAANLLTNPALDPFGKIPEFKYCAAKFKGPPPKPRSSGGLIRGSAGAHRANTDARC